MSTPHTELTIPPQAASSVALPSAAGHHQPVSKAVVYACSGCSDAGELADRIARRLAASGAAEMSCLAGIGGRVKSLMTKGENASEILVIDGCPLNCARKTLELAGLTKFQHLGLNELGLRKGQSPVTDERINLGVEAAKGVLQQVNRS